MKSRITYPDLVLAIATTMHGFAFVLFEGPLTPFDWGVVRVRKSNKNAVILARVKRLIERYHPECMVLEDLTPRMARHSSRIRAFSLRLEHLAATDAMDIYRYDRASIRRCFAPIGARTKVEIGHAIAQQIPAFQHRLPPLRKIWMSEDARQSLFDAAALGMTHMLRTSPKQGNASREGRV